MEFLSLLNASLRTVDDLTPLVIVPALAALANVSELERVARFHGGHVGVAFGIPFPIADLWTFVNTPTSGVVGVPFESTAPHHLAAVIVALVIGSAVAGVVSAGYLGSIHEYLVSSRYDFVANAKRYAVPLVGFYLSLLAIGGGSVLFAAEIGASPGLLLLAIPLTLLIGYLLYATPFLVVTEGLSLVPAARRSVSLATDGGVYVEYFLKYALTVAAISILTTPIVVMGGLGVAVIATIAVAPVGLAFNVSTVWFLAELGPGADPNRAWTAGDRPRSSATELDV